MKKIFFLIVSFIFLSNLAKAQNYHPSTSELSIGIEGELPLNGWNHGITTSDMINMSKMTDFGIGATLKYAYNFNQTISITLQSGFIYFPGNNLKNVEFIYQGYIGYIIPFIVISNTIYYFI